MERYVCFRSLLIGLSYPIQEIREQSLSLNPLSAEVYLLNVSALFYFSNFSHVSSRKWSEKTERERERKRERDRSLAPQLWQEEDLF